MKTIEEKAREYADLFCEGCLSRDSSNCSPTKEKCCTRKRIINNFLAGAKDVTQWISVEDELPSPSDKDLLLRGIDDRGIKGIVDIGYMHEPGTSADNFISLGGVLLKITHWWPIELKTE